MTFSKRMEFCKVVVYSFLSNCDCIWSASTEIISCLLKLSFQLVLCVLSCY